MEEIKLLTINEIWHKGKFELWKDKINHIIAPVGSGKTYWFFETIVKDYKLDEVLYLCDTSNLRDATTMSTDYKDKCYEYKGSFENNKIVVMTYSLAGQILNNNPSFIDRFKLIMCDEAHNLIKYHLKFDGIEHNSFIYARVLNALDKINATILMVTATHRSIQKQMDIDSNNGHGLFSKSYNKLNFDDVKLIKRLKDDFRFTFNNCRNLVQQMRSFNRFEYGEKAIIYTDRIDTIIELEELIDNIGLKAVGVWSINNKTKSMSDERLFVRDYILKSGIIPDNIDVLIINSSYETGINIIDDRVELVIINSSDEDVQIQARGRIRKNIKRLYILDTSDKTNIVINLEDKWINKELTSKDKKELISQYPLYDKRNRLIGWTTFKKILKECGYDIVAGRVLQIKNEKGKIKRLKTEIIRYIKT